MEKEIEEVGVEEKRKVHEEEEWMGKEIEVEEERMEKGNRRECRRKGKSKWWSGGEKQSSGRGVNERKENKRGGWKKKNTNE